MDFGGDNKQIRVSIEWTDTLEDYFAKIGEKAQGYSLLHKQAEGLYSYRTTLIDLPVIILSTVCGTLSIGGQNIFPPEWVDQANKGVGALQIGVGVLNTVGTYFGWSKRAEAHRVSSLQYARMSRFLRVELSLPREERMNCTELLKMVRNDWERLTEISPLIPGDLINTFKIEYKKRQVSKPDEIHGIEPFRIFNTQPKKTLRDILQANLGAIRQIGKEQDTLQHNVIADQQKRTRKLNSTKSFRKASFMGDNYRKPLMSESDTDDDDDDDGTNQIKVVTDIEEGIVIPPPLSPRPTAHFKQ